MKAAWIVLAMLMACGAWAQSQPPLPTKAKQSRPVQKYTQSKAQIADSHQRRTQERPIFLKVAGVPIVEVQTGPKAEQKPAATTDKKDDGTPKQWWLRPDALTAWFTGLLCLIGIVTGAVLICQARLLWRQINLAREEFNAVHRPRIILREAYTVQDLQNPITVLFNIENTGGSEAVIVDSRFTIQFSVAHGTKRQVILRGEIQGDEINRPIPAGEKIPAGAFHTGQCCNELLPWSDRWRQDAVSDQFVGNCIIPGTAIGQARVYFFGKVAYQDAVGIIRNMAFYRMLDFGSYRFVPFNDPQLEYSDEHA